MLTWFVQGSFCILASTTCDNVVIQVSSAVAAMPSWMMSQADRETPARLLRCSSDCVLGQTPRSLQGSLLTANDAAVAAWSRQGSFRTMPSPVPDQARQAAPATPDRAALDQAAQAAQSVAANWDSVRDMRWWDRKWSPEWSEGNWRRDTSWWD